MNNDQMDNDQMDNDQVDNDEQIEASSEGMNAAQIHALSQGIDEGDGEHHYTQEQIHIIDRFFFEYIRNPNRNQEVNPDNFIQGMVSALLIALNDGRKALDMFTMFANRIIEKIIRPHSGLPNTMASGYIPRIQELIKDKPARIKYRIINKIMDDDQAGAFNHLTHEKMRLLFEKYEVMTNTEGGRRKKSTRKRGNKKKRNVVKSKKRVRKSVRRR